MKNIKHHQSQLGMGLVELLVAVAVLGVVVGTASTYFANMNKSFNSESLKDLQVKIAKDIELALSNPDAIKNSANFGGNANLNNCIEPGNTCSTTEPPGSDFTLLDSEAVPNLISGPTIGFDLNGGRCTVGAPKCIFNPVVKFWATCSLDALNKPKNSCTNAGFLNFKYEVRVVNPTYSNVIRTYPEVGAVDSTDMRFVTRMRVADVLIRFGDSCPIGQQLLGFDQQGKAKCECLVQKTITSGATVVPLFDGLGRKICGNQQCPANTLMTGYELKPGNAVVPRCRDQDACSTNSPPTDCPCKIINLDLVGDCGAGFWLVSVTHGICKAVTTKNGKGAPETVECSSRTGRCCSFEQQ